MTDIQNITSKEELTAITKKHYMNFYQIGE